MGFDPLSFLLGWTMTGESLMGSLVLLSQQRDGPMKLSFLPRTDWTALTISYVCVCVCVFLFSLTHKTRRVINFQFFFVC